MFLVAKRHKFRQSVDYAGYDALYDCIQDVPALFISEIINQLKSDTDTGKITIDCPGV